MLTLFRVLVTLQRYSSKCEMFGAKKVMKREPSASYWVTGPTSVEYRMLLFKECRPEKHFLFPISDVFWF